MERLSEQNTPFQSNSSCDQDYQDCAYISALLHAVVPIAVSAAVKMDITT